MQTPDKDKRTARDAGRDKILEAARALFRSSIKPDVNRQLIARRAGVAPALLTYHFESNHDLVLAATEPVLAKAIANLFRAIDEPLPCEERLRKVIVLFLEFAQHDAPLLDIFTTFAIEKRNQGAEALIRSTLEKLGQFFIEAVQAGLIAKKTNPRFLLLALWGMCRLVGEVQPYPLEMFEARPEADRAMQMQVDLILEFTLRGAGARP